MENENGISVLMSVYTKENPNYLKEAVLSMIHQTRQPDEIVIVEDGPLTPELYQVLADLESSFPIIHRYPLAENQGLGLALKYGVEQCRYSLIARMDTDDISVPERLALQEAAFLENEHLGLNGGYIEEFLENPEEIISRREVPLNHRDIMRYQRMRSAFNHMTVMYRKEAVLSAGNYENGLYMEDDLLWLNMIQDGTITSNLDKSLCRVRVGSGMFERRGGTRYLKLYQAARKRMLERHQISYLEYVESLLIQGVVCLVPKKIRQFIFIHLLRK